MKKKNYCLSGIILIMVTLNAYAHRVPDTARVFFITPVDGDVVENPLTIEFGIQGFMIAPVGQKKHKAGHYHLVIDADQVLKLDEPIPDNKTHIHFNKGESQTVINLMPGNHTLQLVVGDEEHEPFEQLISKPIQITVK